MISGCCEKLITAQAAIVAPLHGCCQCEAHISEKCKAKKCRLQQFVGQRFKFFSNWSCETAYLCQSKFNDGVKWRYAIIKPDEGQPLKIFSLKYNHNSHMTKFMEQVQLMSLGRETYNEIWVRFMPVGIWYLHLEVWWGDLNQVQELWGTQVFQVLMEASPTNSWTVSAYIYTKPSLNLDRLSIYMYNFQ